MPLDTATRNELRRVVHRAREVLTRDLVGVLEATFGIHEDGTIEEIDRLPALRDDARNRETRDLLEDGLRGTAGNVGRAIYRERYRTLVRSLAFTHLNRLVAFRIMEHPDIGLIEPSIARWERARGFLRFAGTNPEVGRLYDRGEIDEAYRRYLLSLCARLDREIGVLFDPDDLASRIFPTPRALRQVLDLLDRQELHEVWSEEETIGWVYQFYTPKEQREQARRESSAPRNAYEMAFRNQFYTPEYVVRFLVDNTLGRIWLEMCQGGSAIDRVCSLMVRRPDEVFLDFPRDGAPETADWKAWLRRLVTPPPGQEASFAGRSEDIHRLVSLAHAVDASRRHPLEDQVGGERWPWRRARAVAELGDLGGVPTQDLLDILFAEARANRNAGGTGEVFIEDPLLLRIANEAAARIRRALDPSSADDGPTPTLVPRREPRDPRELRVLDPACGSGHFLSYAFDVLRQIYLEAWEDRDSALREDYPDRETFERTLPTLILEHNLNGIDIDKRATQLASLVLFLKAKATHREAEVHRVNVVCAEPMPGDRREFDEFLGRRLGSESGVVARILSTVWESLRQADELGSVLRLDEEISGAIRKEHETWRRLRAEGGHQGYLFAELAPPDQLELDFSDVTDEQFWDELEARIEALLREFAEEAAGAEALRRRLFADNSVEGLHFVEVMRRRFDVVLMNPPFGAAPVRAQKYIKEHYPRSKQDIYAVFVERFLERLEPGGRLGAVTSRTGFFLSTFQRWREEVVLGEAHPVLVADLGHGVMDDAMVEAAAYVLERVR